jgi:tRNA A37 threonylcarbamoyladenosine synthetase subunit TsaC/SUA5/YrdC
LTPDQNGVKINSIKERRNKMTEEKIIKELQKGNLVIMPTDTIYGIIGDATNEETIKKAFEKEVMINHY